MDENTLRLNECCPALKEFGMGNFVDSVTKQLIAPGLVRGTMYYVDTKSGSNGGNGLSPQTALKDIEAAYNKCVTGNGDGIVLLSAGTTSAETTSYLKKTLTWSKHGITVIGLAAPVRMYGRARIANKDVSSSAMLDCSQAAHSIDRETGSFVSDGWIAGMTGKIADSGSNNGATFTVTAVTALSLTVSETLNVQSKTSTVSCTITNYVANLITVSGSNNTFYNTHIGNFNADVLSVGCVRVTGNRNYFGNCHFIGAGHATPGADAGAYDLLIDGGQENTFEKCMLGTDTIIRAAANGNIVFKGGIWRTFFNDCDIMSYSATSGKGAVKFYDATCCSGVQTFSRCRFVNWNENGIDNSTAAFIGTAPTSGAVLVDACSVIGYTAWDATGKVYVGNSAYTASGGGGIATHV
jgi:hypothetical protein